MMRAHGPLLVLSLVLALSAGAVAEEAPVCDWAFAGGGEGHDKTRGIAFDSEGNLFLASESVGDAVFGEFAHRSAGGMDMVLIKLDPAGRPLWVSSLGGSLTDRAYDVAVDPAGNAYVTGHFESVDAVAAGALMPNAGDYDVFVAKFSPEGRLLWVRTAGGAGYDYGHAIAIDPAGDVVVAGAVQGRAAFGDLVIDGAGGRRAPFCAKYDSDGVLKWVRGSSGGLSGSGHGVAVDGEGSIYVGGSASGEGRLGDLEISAKSPSALVAKLSPEGGAVWASLVPGTTSAIYHEIACDGSGRVWGAGMFKGEVRVAGESFRSGGENDYDGLVVHLSEDGAPAWARQLKGPGTDYCLGVAVDGEGTAYVCGSFRDEAELAGRSLVSRGGGDLFLAAFGGGGSLLWTVTAGGERGDSAYPLAYRAPGFLAMAGAFGGPARFGPHQLPHVGGNDLHGSLWRLPGAR